MGLTEIFEKISNVNLNFTILDAIDILLLTATIYGLLRLTQKTRASQVLKGLGVFIVLTQLCKLIGLSAMSWALNLLIEAGVIIIVVIFQPEIRRALERVGRNKIFSMVGGGEVKDYSREIEEIERAVLDMSKHKVGALIVFENHTGLNDVIESGHIVDARITSELLENIFFHNAPLHDGAMIIRDGRICASGCFLPLSQNYTISKEMGTRHRAALGMSENSDAVVVVVSEETGTISIAQGGVIERNFTIPQLEKRLYHEILRKDEGEQQKEVGVKALLRKVKK